MFIKRLFDFIVSAIALFFLSPLFLVVAIRIKKEDGGKVFYRGERIGRYGKTFRIYKFRSMYEGADKTGVDSSSNEDDRITKVGHFIRKYKLDELSQLINIFKGDMSFVGPRPQVLSYLEKFSAEERETLKLRPGITDWASIKFNDEGGIIAASGIEDADEAYDQLIHPLKMKYQIKYLHERSFKVDMQILINTVKTILSTRQGGEPIGVPPLDD